HSPIWAWFLDGQLSNIGLFQAMDMPRFPFTMSCDWLGRHGAKDLEQMEGSRTHARPDFTRT
ncbi:hypothetical protein OFC13_29790, partial [Escherichia coli]|nr:hypothetical protein [Escherichia coli]